jgi:NadR type nicotinamide-nucleotide adenylyltransferase
MGDREDRDDSVMWAGGGSWEPPADPPSVSLPAEPIAPVPGKKPEGRYGPSEPLGETGLVVGRFLPLHRGHQYLIEFAKRSVKALTVVVLSQADDPVATVHVLTTPVKLGAPGWQATFAAAVHKLAPKVSHFFSSELAYREAAHAIRAQFVPVDPSRIAVPISGTAIRTNVMDHFHYLAPAARPWFVRRIAVVGAESTGKSTLCARLREELGATIVPEWTRVLVESGQAALASSQVQLAARSQIASEDALARQPPGANGGLLVCDTELRTIQLWAERLFTGDTNPWIGEAARARPYDLYLLCMPDIPFIGAREWDRPEERRRFHAHLTAALAGQPVVELAGSRDDRFRVAADAIIGLFQTNRLLSARGARITDQTARGVL